MLSGRTQAGRRGRAVLAACALAGLAAVAGCTSGGSQPSWAGALGSGVAVDSPRSASPGNGSPEAVLIGVATAYSTHHYTDLCRYVEPSQRSGCISAWSGNPGLRVDLADFPLPKNVKPGYTAIDGDKALVGFTGNVCVLKLYPSCFTNNDPAAILDSGKSFSALWSQSLMSLYNAYYLSPAIKVNGNWYAYTVNDTIVYF
jgi:hypothetical protein